MSSGADEFSQIIELYESTVSSVTDPQDYFSSEEYHNAKRLAALVFNTVKSNCEVFIRIVEGLSEGSEVGHAGIERVLCFPKRFLKKPSVDALSDELRIMIDSIIRDTFLLGLMSHLFLFTFPTRGDAERVDIDGLFYQWLPEALIADRRMKEYNKEINRLPLRVFESYFSSSIDLVLKEKFRVGFWKRGQCHSFLKNLFFAGARLGMMFDLKTKNLV